MITTVLEKEKEQTFTNVLCCINIVILTFEGIIFI